MKGNQSPQNQHPYPEKFTFPKTMGRVVGIKNLQIDTGIGNKPFSGHVLLTFFNILGVCD